MTSARSLVRALLGPALFAGATLSLGLGLGACAAILGFEDTTVRGDVTEGGVTDGPSGDDGGGGGDAAAGRLSATPSSIVLRRGASVIVEVDLVRGTDVTGDVDAQLADLPAGVSAMAAPLHGGASKGTLTL